MSQETTTPWYAGALVGDRYRLVARIAGGGMGEVWRGDDTVLGRPVAVKVLRSEHAQDADFRERLRREARAAGSISHAHAVPVYDFGDETQVNGPHLSYLVMQFVDGPALAERLHTGAIGVEQTLKVIEETASALQAAHSAGIVHRDIKPGNILVDPEENFKITDFGIARAGDALPLTRTGMLTGTAKYLSPEQAGGKSATAASDIYSLGVVAYQCLSGRVPFENGNEVAIALAQIQDDPPDLPPEVPADVKELVMSMLAKDPQDRPLSAGAVAFAAQSLRGESMTGESTAAYAAADVATAGESTQAMAAAPMAVGIGEPATAAMEVPPSREQTPAQSAAPRRRRPLMLLMLAVAVLALIAGVGAAFLGGSEHAVPDVVGDQLTAAEATLKKQNFAVTSQKANVAGKKAGTVVAQTPAAGAQRADDSTVELTVASGLVDIPVKTLIGKSYADAASILKKLGLDPARENQTSSKGAGTVIGVDPDTTAKIGTTVTLAIATPPPAPTYVPPPQPTPKSNGNKDNKQQDNKKQDDRKQDDRKQDDNEQDDNEQDDKKKDDKNTSTDQKSIGVKDLDR